MITACQGVPACKYAVVDPPENLGALLNKLQSSVIAYDKENSEKIAFFTDRRYFKNQGSRSNRYSPVSNNLKPRCNICQKENCRSWNHTEQEKETCKTKFRNMIKSRLNSRPFNDKHFQDRFRQYIMDCEFSDIDNGEVQEEELNEVFSSLVIDMQINHDYFPIDNDKENLTTYFSNYGEIDLRNAVSTTSELANKIYIHSVTKIDNTSNVPSE
ncbi:hypothetical protein HI914_05110 [Erysiphe necator]|nr:hypothetical protein HI914_05110 [Erysiphe necator]